MDRNVGWMLLCAALAGALIFFSGSCANSKYNFWGSGPAYNSRQP